VAVSNVPTVNGCYTHIQFNLNLQTAVLLTDLWWSILDARLVDGYDAAAIGLLRWHHRHLLNLLLLLRLLRLLLLLILALEGLLVLAVALGSFILGLNRLVLLRALLLLVLILSLGSGRKSSAGYVSYLPEYGKGNDELFGSHFEVEITIRLGVGYARFTLKLKRGFK